MGWGEVAQTIYTHISKCKNDKIKGEREKKKAIQRPSTLQTKLFTLNQAS
jgi:hypothetical protein